MSRTKKITWGGLAAAVLLLVASWQLRWFTSEPTYHGRTVTEWLDRLTVYEDEALEVGYSPVFTEKGVAANGGRWWRSVSRPAEIVTNDPAYLALMKFGPRAVPILVQRVMDPAEWPPDVGAMSRSKMWFEWKWKQARGAKGVKRPAPSRFSESQSVRKTTAGFVLLALGTNIHAGFPAYMQAYADAPKHQTIYRTQISGSPIGVSSSDVARLGKALLPHRREEILGEILKGMEYTNAWCRTVAVEMTWEFPEEFARFKNSMLRLTRDENPMVQEATFGRLHSLFFRRESAGVMSPLELERAADAVLQDPKTTARVRGVAESVKRSAQGKPAE